jgi:hypothetical protein
MANAARIRELKLENIKLRTTLERLRADVANRRRFEQLSLSIMDSWFMDPQAESVEATSDSASMFVCHKLCDSPKVY